MIRTPSRRRYQNKKSRFTSTPYRNETKHLNETLSQCISLSPIPPDEVENIKIEDDGNKLINFESLNIQQVKPSYLQLKENCKKTDLPVELDIDPVCENNIQWTPKRPRSPTIRSSKMSNQIILHCKKLLPITYPCTPRCARPTKAWLSRNAPPIESPEVEKTKSTLTEEEREKVWQRLLQSKSRLQS